jgi:hypothetical protein
MQERSLTANELYWSRVENRRNDDSLPVGM